VARVGTRVGQGLVTFVQALSQRQRGLGRETKFAVGLALQAGQVKQAGAGLRGGRGLFGHAGRLAAHRVDDGLRFGGGPLPVGFLFGVFFFFPGRVEPLAGIGAGSGGELGVDFPIVAAHELADLLFALDHHGQRGRLHPAHGGQEEAAIARVERGHGAGAVDAHQPVGFRPAAGGVGQALHLLFAAQAVKAVADRLWRHGLQPQALDGFVQRLGATCVLLDQAEDQFPLAPRVAGVDEAVHVFAFGLPDHGAQAALGFVHRLQVKVRRDHGQVGKTPLAAFHVVLLGGLDLHQVAHRAGDHIAVVLEMVVVFLELARGWRQGFDDVLSHRRLLCNYQGLHVITIRCLACAHAPGHALTRTPT